MKRKEIFALILLTSTLSEASAIGLSLSGIQSITKISRMNINFKGVRFGGLLTKLKIFKSPDEFKISTKFIHMAGKQCFKTGIWYNKKGYPIFNKVSACDLKLSKEIAEIQDRYLHFRTATKMLKESIQKKKISSSKFNQEQLESISKEEAYIPGYTWHHHQDFGKMQLIPREIHKNTPHEGGYSSWY